MDLNNSESPKTPRLNRGGNALLGRNTLDRAQVALTDTAMHALILLI